MSVLRRWRSWAYGAVTYAGHERLARIRSRPAGAAALALVEAALSGGSVRVGGGAGGGLELAGGFLPVDHAQGYALVRGVLEPGVQEALRRHVRPGAVVYDVGANIGFFSLLAARLAGPAGRVEAFEPIARSATAVAVNARLNGLSGAIGVRAVAVGEAAGMAELLVNREHSWSHLADRGEHPQARARVGVPVVGLDAMIERGEIAPPDVVKIDVEGSEGAVLRGLARTLAARPVVVIVELHETNAEVAGLLGALGYELDNLDGTAPAVEAGPVHVLARRPGG
jgi:FkbM family methyltransferase